MVKSKKELDIKGGRRYLRGDITSNYEMKNGRGGGGDSIYHENKH